MDFMWWGLFLCNFSPSEIDFRIQMSKQYDTVIIGGGVIGLFSAYYLVKAGQRVLVLDKGPRQQASSHGNCGLVSPSHIMPLNSFDLIVKSVGWLFKKDAPFRIKPQFDRHFINWSLKFMKHASAKSIAKHSQAIHDLVLSSRNLFSAVLEEEGWDCHWSANGIHFVSNTRKEFDAYHEVNDYTRNFGVTAIPIKAPELLELEPALKENVYGSWFYDIDAWLKPDDLLHHLRVWLDDKGCDLINEAEVTDFKSSNGALEAVITRKQGDFLGNTFLLATGAWTPLLKNAHHLKVPIVPGKGYSITMKSPEIVPKVPINMLERKVVATPWKGSYRLGSTMEFAGYDDSLNKTRLEALKRGAAEYLREPYTDEVEEEWYGWRPMTYDGVPIIDRSPRHKNLYLAVGHNMLGLSMSTGTGKLVTELITGQKTHLNPSLYQYRT